MNDQSEQASIKQAQRSAARKRLLGALAVVLLAAALGYGVWWWLVGSREVSTDNAYVGGDVAQITPLVAAAVRDVRVGDTQAVKRGDVLVVLDDTDQRLAVATARAELDRAIRRVRGYRATDRALAAQASAQRLAVASARAGVGQAQATLERARLDYERRKGLAGSGAVSDEEISTARAAYTVARSDLQAAQARLAQAEADVGAAAGSLAANQTLTDGADIQNNPEVAAARARLHMAEVDLSRTVLRAPFDGVVAQRKVQIGQRAQIGTALMSVVPVDRLYVDANFKEVQLAHVHAGQPVTLVSDLYGDDVVYHGTVVGRGGGTGSAFAIIPAQNATGNWIKVVQRVPIRIALDPKELAEHPLLIGLSMTVSIDIER